jgi:hypothetical protein
METIERALTVYSHSRSYRLFKHTINRTRELLKWTSSGLIEAQSLPNQILEKIRRAQAGIPVTENPDDISTITLTFSEEDLKAIEFAIKSAQEILYNRMHFHLHEVILVALWSSFESYLQGIIQQFYTQNISQLASDKQVTYRDLIDNNISIPSYLIERELTDFGRLSLTDMKKYIKGRIKYDFNEDEIIVLNETYFLRNVAAHNSGFIRPNQQSLVPDAIGVRNNQIEISREYLEAKIVSIEAIVERMDAYVIDRWNVAKSTDALFEDIPRISGTES